MAHVDILLKFGINVQLPQTIGMDVSKWAEG